MPDRRPSSDGGSKLSPQTLVVASLSSLTAAIVTSHFWRGGTPITAAITPVIVSLASELYSRPARRITEFGSKAATRTRDANAPSRSRERVLVPPDRRRTPPLEPPAPGAGQIRVYRSESASRRRVRLKVAIATAATAFVIAAVVLTVPELVFGGSVASHGKTTFFGGHKHKRSTNHQNTQTTPSTTAPAPTTTAPAPTATTPPAQTVPQTTTPTTPPPAGGAPAPQGTTGQGQ